MVPTERFLAAVILVLALLATPPADAARVNPPGRHHRLVKHRHKQHAATHHGSTIHQSSTPPPPGSSGPTPAAGGDSSPAPQASGSCANADLRPTQANLPLATAATLCLVNRVRAQHGLAAFSVAAKLQRIAQGYAAQMVADDFFAHVTPAGQTPVDRFVQSGFLPRLLNVAYSVGENLGWGTGSRSTPAGAVAAWIRSPEHLANILNPRYRETGIGIAPGVPRSFANGQTGATYAEEFGSVQA